MKDLNKYDSLKYKDRYNIIQVSFMCRRALTFVISKILLESNLIVVQLFEIRVDVGFTSAIMSLLKCSVTVVEF